MKRLKRKTEVAFYKSMRPSTSYHLHGEHTNKHWYQTLTTELSNLVIRAEFFTLSKDVSRGEALPPRSREMLSSPRRASTACLRYVLLVGCLTSCSSSFHFIKVGLLIRRQIQLFFQISEPKLHTHSSQFINNPTLYIILIY